LVYVNCILARGPLSFDGWYPRDHKPGPFPETEEERRSAALKYGMRPEDYRPIHYDDVNRHAGDYPYLGTITYDHKDPYESWSDRHHRRNWGELVPIDSINYRADRLTFTGLNQEDFEWLSVLYNFLSVLIPLGIICYLISRPHPNAPRWRNPAMPKQYSYDYYRAWPFSDPRKYPITNYSFEPLD
uniref:NADH dehydrogenase [ubiquinone] 1 beta subcomplex subunit 8, mitochondrial n=1 Tax=Syphacia muris TaxID=451379 RepID=A0A0N5AKH6_9BILA